MQSRFRTELGKSSLKVSPHKNDEKQKGWVILGSSINSTPDSLYKTIVQ